MREHYLRPAADFAPPPVLPAGLAWILPDTNAVLHQFDLLASPDLPHPLLVAQTVLDEVRHRSLPLYNKLRTLIDDDFAPTTTKSTGEHKLKRGWTVWNEALEETFLERKEGESPNDRNDRAIRHLASYYTAILRGGTSANKRQKTGPSSASSSRAVDSDSSADAPLILLTDDAANLALARKAGLRTLTAKEYVASLPDSVQHSLVDLLAVGGSGLERHGNAASGSGKRKAAALYAEHLPQSVLQAGVKAGKYVQGHFNPSQYNFREVSDLLYFLPGSLFIPRQAFPRN